MNHRFIAIEGNIGAGKTTLSQLLSQHYNAKLVLEEFAENPFLTKFYENPKQYAFPLELFFLAERFKQQQELVKNKDLFQEVMVSDSLKANFIPSNNQIVFGQGRDFDFMGYHKLENISGHRAMSLHLYAKPIKKCNVFDDSKKTFSKKTLSFDTVSSAY